ncbi:MAG: hypothetical protein H6Q25_265 [Bacteroidetes bacterium]|nr:hypothetical protein [Bacteroidota bacterium]
MKKVFLTLACVAFLAAISTSCVKSCYCVIDSDPEEYIGEMTSAQCSAFESAGELAGQTITCDAR